jgi:cell wall-associated NlpC family hydrolase
LPAFAQGALAGDTIVGYLEKRDDLGRSDRQRWIREVKKRFGAAAIDEDSADKPEIGVAKAILSAAIFMGVKPKEAAASAWEGWRGALGYVPPPIAIHYQILTLEGRRPRGRPIDLAFHFPDYYSDEIAPDLVAYWEAALAAGTIPDDALVETKEALEQTRELMRPLLLDKLRLLARLERERVIAGGLRKVEIERDRAEVEDELARSFSRVARRPEVLDRKRRAYDRLRIHLEDMGLTLTDEDRFLNPDGAPPPKKVVPPVAEPEVPADAEPQVEPEGPPIPPIPDQPRAGDPTPPKDPVEGRSLLDLVKAYGRRIEVLVEPWLGTPYLWGSSKPKVGTDCSGFMQGLFGAFSVSLPRTSRDQFRVGDSVRKAELRPGDLVFFDTRDVGQISHVGVYAGDGKFAHASSSRGVVYDELESRYFRRAFRGARRVLAYPIEGEHLGPRHPRSLEVK